MRKFAQLVSHEGGLYAVADDGTAWVWSERAWGPLSDLPQPPASEGDEKTEALQVARAELERLLRPAKVRERDV